MSICGQTDNTLIRG